MYIKNGIFIILMHNVFFWLHLCRGSADVLKRRLKDHYSKESLKMAGLSSDVPIQFDYLCVIDVEATCQEINPVDYIHEIIEFPIVLLNTKTLQIVSGDSWNSSHTQTKDV